MTAKPLGIVLGLGFVVSFLVLWTFILWIISRVSGWHRLAQQYGDTSLFSGEIVRFGSARIGWANYNGALNVGANDMGVYLAPMAIFRPFHPPLFIPWSAVESQPFQGFPSGVTLSFPGGTGARIVLFGRALKPVQPYLGGSALT
jgi:hypothetical protein